MIILCGAVTKVTLHNLIQILSSVSLTKQEKIVERGQIYLTLCLSVQHKCVYIVMYVCLCALCSQFKCLTIVFTDNSGSSGILYNFLQEEKANILYMSKQGVFYTHIRLQLQRGSRPMAKVLRKRI